MKRLILIACSFLVVFAGVAAAWESCKQISFVSDDHHRSAPAHGHDHHSQSDRHHSNNGAIHCPPMGDYVPTATFTISPDNRVERLPETPVGEYNSQFSELPRYRLIHGPPGFSRSSIISPYLFLSVLRI